MTSRCVGCNAEAPEFDGPIHRYMTSSPACWQRYGELLGVLYTRPALGQVLAMCVDSYAAQHPGTPNPQAIQSVAVHLVNLHGYLERGRPVGPPQMLLGSRAFHAPASPNVREPYWMDPPSFAGTRTVFDMPLDGADDSFIESARAWAESVWNAWRPRHAQVAEWYGAYAKG